MKKRYFLLTLAIAALCASAQSKLDMDGSRLVYQYKELIRGNKVNDIDPRLTNNLLQQSPMEVSRAASSNQDFADNEVGVIVRLNNGFTEDDLKTNNYEVVRTLSDNSCIVSVPVSKLEELSDLPEVQLASVGSIKETTMFKARPSAHIDEIHQGTGMDRGYKGKGVVVGIFDTGIDPAHINFTDGTDYETTRVREARAYTGSNGKPTKTATTPEQIATFYTDNTGETHGTHCIGIAAGSYNGIGTYSESGTLKQDVNMNTYGVAPEADIVMGGGSLYDANILAGVQDVINYAEANKKPAVINLSLGSLIGEHDGTSQISQQLAELGKRAIICVAAGNDAGTKLAFSCIGGALAAGKYHSVGFSNYVSGKVPSMLIYSSSGNVLENLEFVVVDVTLNKVVYSYPLSNTNGSYIRLGGKSTSYTNPTEQAFNEAFTADSYIQFRTFVNATNKKFTIEVAHTLKQGTNTAYKPGLRFHVPTNTTVNGYVSEGEFTSHGNLAAYTDSNNGLKYQKWTDGTDDGSISAMATGENILVVGAYTSNVNFGYIGGGAYSYNGHTAVNEVAPFSSYGSNTETNEKLPHICAPGSVLISSLNTFDPTDATYTKASGLATKGSTSYYWGPMQGTSMATPFITGTVALMLEANPKLTIDDVKDIIKKTGAMGSNQTSRLAADNQTERNKQWGAGKIQAAEAVKEVIVRKAGINSVFEDDNKRLIITQNEGELNVFVAGETNLTATLYSTLGAQVAKAHAADQELTLSTAGLQKGIYILNANGTTGRYSQKILVK